MSDELATIQPAAVATIVPNAQNLRILSTDLFNSRMFRGVESPAQAVAIIQMGSELGFGPVTALNVIKIIQGQMTVAARGLLALAQNKAGVTWKLIRSDDDACVILFSRPKWEDMEATFTYEEAKAAGLVRAGGGWDKYRKDMLFARCASRGIRRIAPDAISGLYATEEIQDSTPFKNHTEPTTGGQGDRPSGEQHAGSQPAPAPAPSFTRTPDGQDEDIIDAEEVPPDEPDAPEPVFCLTKSDGSIVKATRTEAKKMVSNIIKVVGEKNYRETIGSLGYEHFDDIPGERVPDVYATLVELARITKAKK